MAKKSSRKTSYSNKDMPGWFMIQNLPKPSDKKGQKALKRKAVAKFPELKNTSPYGIFTKAMRVQGKWKKRGNESPSKPKPRRASKSIHSITVPEITKSPRPKRTPTPKPERWAVQLKETERSIREIWAGDASPSVRILKDVTKGVPVQLYEVYVNGEVIHTSKDYPRHDVVKKI